MRCFQSPMAVDNTFGKEGPICYHICTIPTNLLPLLYLHYVTPCSLRIDLVAFWQSSSYFPPYQVARINPSRVVYTLSDVCFPLTHTVSSKTLLMKLTLDIKPPLWHKYIPSETLQPHLSNGTLHISLASSVVKI